MPYQIWKCSICDKECNNKAEAIKCEKQKVDPIEGGFKVGDIVLVETEYESTFRGPIVKETVERTVVEIKLGCSKYTPDGGMHDWFLVLDKEISFLAEDDEGNQYFDTTDEIEDIQATKKP